MAQNKQRFTLWLDPDLANWVDETASEQHRSRNQQVIHVLESYRENSGNSTK